MADEDEGRLRWVGHLRDLEDEVAMFLDVQSAHESDDEPVLEVKFLLQLVWISVGKEDVVCHERQDSDLRSVGKRARVFEASLRIDEQQGSILRRDPRES